MTWGFALVALGVLWLAWNNGANDNFKGVATLYGSGVLGYRGALWLTTLATLAGSLLSIWLAHGLVQVFSGNGLISGGATMNDAMLAAIGISAGVTILLATLLGMPTSTTHALTGAMVGVALVADSSGINWMMLTDKFAKPLLLSPLIAVALTLVLYLVLHRLRQKLGVGAESCLCLGDNSAVPALSGASSAAIHGVQPALELAVGNTSDCAARYGGRVIGLDVGSAVNALHVLSAGSVCFARAVNDTPKIAALLLAAGALGGQMQSTWIMASVALMMALGGVVQSRKVAETLSRRITQLNHGQGLTANLVTAGLVMGASGFGLPVSTTHVSTGAIFGIGMVNGKRNWRTITGILLTWLVTLPMGLMLGAAAYVVFRGLIA